MPSHEIDISEESGVRYLHFGSAWVQGAMRIRRPIDLELAYTREMMAGLLMREDWLSSAASPYRILLVGLGAGSLTKFCYWKLSNAHCTVVEINPAVWAAARHYFKLPADDARLTVNIADGVEFLRTDSGTYDYILVDGYDQDAKVGQLDSVAFYESCRARLSLQGVLSANMFGRSRHYEPSLKRLATAFGQRALAFPSCDSGNVVAFAAHGDTIELSLVELRQRAVSVKAATGLDLRPTVTRLEQSHSLPGGVLRL
jgi:spermidine synthase